MERMRGNKHKTIKELLHYYIHATNGTIDRYILNVQRGRNRKGELEYSEWLALEISALLEEKGIRLKDCLAYRGYFNGRYRQKKNKDPEGIWIEEIQEVLHRNYRGKLVVELDGDALWVESLRGSGYEVIDLSRDPELDFYNEYAFGPFDRTFYDKLPERLKVAVEKGEEILFSVNGYKRQSEDMANTYEEMKLFGLGKYNKPEMMALFRVIRFKEEYGLENAKISFFSGMAMFTDESFYEFFEFLKAGMGFERGVCFDGKVIGLKERLIGYSLWGKSSEVPVIFREKVQLEDGSVLKGLKKLQRMHPGTIEKWFLRGQPNGGEKLVPEIARGRISDSKKVSRAENVLCYTKTSAKPVRNQKNIKLLNYPASETHAIYEENFLQNVAAHAIRVLVCEKYKDKVVDIKRPDTSIWGYKKWLSEAVMLFIYDTHTDMISGSGEQRQANRLFPLAKSEVARLVGERVLLEDLEEKEENEYMLKVLKGAENVVGVEAMALHNYCKTVLRQSLRDGIREKEGYAYGTFAWDCPLQSVVKLKAYEKEKKQYEAYLEALKEKLVRGISKYGFISE